MNHQSNTYSFESLNAGVNYNRLSGNSLGLFFDTPNSTQQMESTTLGNSQQAFHSAPSSDAAIELSLAHLKPNCNHACMETDSAMSSPGSNYSYRDDDLFSSRSSSRSSFSSMSEGEEDYCNQKDLARSMPQHTHIASPGILTPDVPIMRKQYSNLKKDSITAPLHLDLSALPSPFTLYFDQLMALVNEEITYYTSLGISTMDQHHSANSISARVS